MKPVSEAYKSSVKSMLRGRSFVRVTFGNVDPSAATDGEWVSNGEHGYSEFDTVDYYFDYPESYASLELNRWALDGKTRVTPSSGPMQDGFISSLMSDAEGNLSTPVVLVREFSKPHIFPGLSLTFDTRCREWPPGVTVDFYLNGAVVDTQTVSVTGTEVVAPTTATEIDKLVVTFGGSLPYRRPRLERVLYGEEKMYSNAEIVSTRQAHDVDPLTRRLPQETMQFEILDYEHKYDPENPSGIYAYVDKNSPVEIQFGYELDDGSVEWVKGDKYVMNAKPTAQNNKATFTGTGLIGSLSGIYHKSKLGNKSFYDMAEEVLVDADLTPARDGTNPWVIDEALKEMYTTAALPIDTHMNCLQLIAHACRCCLFTDDDNIIHIKPFNVHKTDNFEPSFVLDFSSIAENSQTLSKIDQLKSVSVTRYSYTVSGDTQTLFEGTTTETQLHVEFSGLAQDVKISVTGGTLVSSDVYARAADLVLSSGTKTVVVTGKSLSENSVVVSYPVSSEGEIDKEDNPLITNDEMCSALAAHIAEYLQMRNTYDVSYRGNPEVEVRDIISLQTPYTADMNALVLVDEITFNGSLSGKVKVKGLI